MGEQSPIATALAQVGPRLNGIRTKRGVRDGRTVIPLTPHPGPLQAWKSIIPAEQTRPEPRTHEGYGWFYVLSGRLRLIVADHDVILEPGEATEFDTRLPHWFGTTGESPVEVLNLFGGQGERVHARASPHLR